MHSAQYSTGGVHSSRAAYFDTSQPGADSFALLHRSAAEDLLFSNSVLLEVLVKLLRRILSTIVGS